MLELAEEEKHMESVSAGIRMNSLRWANEIEQIVLEHTHPAGTMLPVPAEPEGINIDQLLNSVAINNGRKPITPKTKGEEIPLDCSGHSDCFKWIPDPNETFWYKQKEYTYASLFEKYKAYGLDGIEYHNQLPDFSPFADSSLGSPYLDEMPTERLGEEGSYRKASEWVVEHSEASHDLSRVLPGI